MEQVSFSYVRPDGSMASVFGTPYALIRFNEARHDKKLQHNENCGCRGLTGKVADGIFGEKATVIGSSTVAQWREFAGPVFIPEDVEEDCDECNGGGLSECPHCGQDADCESCDGTGKVKTQTEQPDRPAVRVGKLAIDPRHFSALLEMVSDGSVVVSANANKVYLTCDAWAVVAMSQMGNNGSIVEFSPSQTREGV